MVISNSYVKLPEGSHHVAVFLFKHLNMKWVCLKIVYPYTQWFCWSLSLLNGYNWKYTLFSDKPKWLRWDREVLQHLQLQYVHIGPRGMERCRPFAGDLWLLWAGFSMFQWHALCSFLRSGDWRWPNSSLFGYQHHNIFLVIPTHSCDCRYNMLSVHVNSRSNLCCRALELAAQ